MNEGCFDPLRRTVLRMLALAGAGVSVGVTRAGAAGQPPPKEGGLSSEGLLAGLPGFHARTAAPLPYAEVPGFLSRAQLAAHHAEYAKAVEALKNAEQALGSAERNPTDMSGYTALRRQQVASANDVLLHDFYFGGLAPSKVEVSTYVRRNMNEHMGSLESWAADFTLCALAAQAWAALVYDPYDDRWHNVVMDSDVDGIWVGGNPLIVCDVAAHAYSTDYAQRAGYVAKFVDHIDWDTVAKRYHRVDRM
jgi:Fe-Mn family superoxide dismutase